MTIQTKELGTYFDDIAPDGSEIRLLLSTEGASLCHVTLPAGKTSQAVRHQTVEEIWHFVQGQGEVWRELAGQADTVTVRSGFSLTIPTGAHFQFRNTGSEPLSFLCVTLPPWPGPEEAVLVQNHWPLDP